MWTRAVRRSPIACMTRSKAARISAWKLAVFGAALLDQALGDGEPRLVAGQRDAKLGALQFEIGPEAEIAAENAAADRRDDDDRLHEVAEVDVGGEMRVQHAVMRGHLGT